MEVRIIHYIAKNKYINVIFWQHIAIYCVHVHNYTDISWQPLVHEKRKIDFQDGFQIRMITSCRYLHTKFHQNWWSSVGEKSQNNDIRGGCSQNGAWRNIERTRYLCVRNMMLNVCAAWLHSLYQFLWVLQLKTAFLYENNFSLSWNREQRYRSEILFLQSSRQLKCILLHYLITFRKVGDWKLLFHMKTNSPLIEIGKSTTDQKDYFPQAPSSSSVYCIVTSSVSSSVQPGCAGSLPSSRSLMNRSHLVYL